MRCGRLPAECRYRGRGSGEQPAPWVRVSRFDTYDTAAYEQFCADLVEAGFNPKPNNATRWIGPLRPSLREFTDANFMEIQFRDGWPLRHTSIIVDGLRGRHASNGIVCLWSEDDPAQIAGAT